jgi:hypothetical protein
MSKPGIHRVTADSRQGRSMVSRGMPHKPWLISREIQEHNERVEAKKLAKKAKRSTALGAKA